MVVITGGPGAGKTALLEVARRHFCRHVGFAPEAASLLFRGGFPRNDSSASHQRAVQRAIFHVQYELERIAEEDPSCEVVLCDRGTVDGAAYWPAGVESFWEETGMTQDEQLLRYDAVIHLMTPPASEGYNHANPERLETADQAAAIDHRLALAWAGHPHRYVAPWTEDFVSKLSLSLALIRDLLPESCRDHSESHRIEHLGQSTAARRSG
jgi:predicted ATPase